MWLFLRSQTGDGHGYPLATPVCRSIRDCSGSPTHHRNSAVHGIGCRWVSLFLQSYVLQLYEAPMFMPFVAVAAILIERCIGEKATITHVIIGTVLFLGILK